MIATNIAQNIVEICHKYFRSFIAIETFPQHCFQKLQNILIFQYFNIIILTFRNIFENK